MVWFLEDNERLSSERDAIDLLHNNTRWLKNVVWVFSGNCLAVQADIDVDGVLHSVLLRYPQFFPASPPTVKPQKGDEHWSGHQYGAGGELCLEWGPDNWEPHITGANMLTSAYKLLSNERDSFGEKRINVASRHKTSLGQALRGSLVRIGVSSEVQSYFAELPAPTTGSFEFLLIDQSDSYTILLTSICPDDCEIWTAPELPQGLTRQCRSPYKGRFAVTDLICNINEELSTDALASTLSSIGCEMALSFDSEDQKLKVLILRNQAGELKVLLLPESGKTRLLSTFSLNPHQWKRSGVHSEFFDKKRVGIVGLGSIGSKVALSLARSGVQNFLLIDDDVFLPENCERHTLDYRNVGEHKVDAVKTQIECLTSTVTVDVARIKLSGQEASSSTARRLKQLSECDIIVDATATSRVFNMLAETARQAQIAMVWVEVFAGGIGGILARYRPGKDPDPFTMRAKLNSYLSTKKEAPQNSSMPYTGQTDDGIPLIATDAEVAILSDHAARFVLDFLEEREPSAFPSSLYLVGLERGWIFEAPFHTIALDVGEVSELNLRKSTLSKENAKFLGTIIENALDDSNH